MAFSGNFIDAATADRWGLLGRVVAPEALLPTCLVLAQDIASAAPDMLRAYKRLIEDGAQLPLGVALALERERSNAWSAELAPADLSERREKLVQRGRRQIG